MQRKNTIAWTIAVTLALASGSANAWFFFFIPGGLISKIGDAITGAQGDNCVSSTAKVGDVLTSPAGNTATIKSVGGTWSGCKNPVYPIRALLEFNYSFFPEVGIDLPDGFKPKDLTALQRFNGGVLNAFDSQRTIGLFVFVRPHKPGFDGRTIAHTTAENILKAIEDGKASDEEQLTINGLHAYRFQIVGKNKGIFGESYTYVVTVLDGKDMFVVLNANCRTDNFEEYKSLLGHFAFDVKGISTDQSLRSTAASHEAQATDAALKAKVGLPAQTLDLGSGDQKDETATAHSGENPGKPSSIIEPPVQPRGGTDVIVERLRALEKLLKEGLITQEDYESKKRELLKEL